MSHGARTGAGEAEAEYLEAFAVRRGKARSDLIPCTRERAALCHLHQRQGLRTACVEAPCYFRSGFVP